MRALLHHRGFVRLWIGQFLSLLADWSLRAMLLIWVYTLTHSGEMVSLVGLAEALPLLVLAPIAGAIVDRRHRAHTMAGVVLARAVLVLPLLAVSTRAQLPLIVVVTVLVSIASQFFGPAAAAATPSIVGQESLGQANSLLSWVTSTVGVAGPAAGALLFTTLGPHYTVALLSALYLLAAPVLAGIPAPAPDGAGTGAHALLGEIAQGMGYVTRTYPLPALVGCAFVFSLGAGALTVLDVLFVTRALHLHSQVVSVLYAANGAGALVGSLLMTASARRVAPHYHLILSLGILAEAGALLVYAAAPTLLVAGLAAGMVGFVFTLALVSYITLVQLSTADAVMGRVISVALMAVAAGQILSLAGGGVLADTFGVRQVVACAAAIIALCGVLDLLLIRETPAPRTQQQATKESADPVAAIAIA